MEGDMRKSGIDILGDLPWGTHFCQFYQTKEDLLDILVPYFKAGLEINELCMWVTSYPLSVEEASESLRKAVPDFDHFQRQGQIEIISHSDWYLKGGVFDSAGALNDWVGKLNQALARGYDGLRITGNIFRLDKETWRELITYEEKVEAVIGQYPIIAICSYPLEECSPVEILNVVRNHQFALIKKDGRWERLESSERRRTLFVEISDRKRAEQRADLLAKTAAELLRSESPQTVVDSLCREVMAFLGCHVFFNFLVNDEAGCLHLNACAGIPDEEAQKIEWLDYGVAVCGCAARDGCRIVAENIPEMPDPRTDLVCSYGVKAYACHPLTAQGRVLGTLSFGTRERSSFTEEELSVMKTVADLVAIAIQRKQAVARIEAARLEAVNDRKRIEAVMEALPVGLAIVDSQGGSIQANRVFEEIWGCPRPDIRTVREYGLYKAWWAESGLPLDPEEWASARAVQRGETVTGQLIRIERFDGGHVFVHNSAAPIFDVHGGIVGSAVAIMDITSRMEAEEALRQALREKDTLLKELYHRTKNNMSVISSLITLQTSALSDGETLQMFRNLQNRIRSMAMVHEKMYQSRDLSRVDFRDYLFDLASALIANYRLGREQVRLMLDIESFPLSIDALTPCGLIINEIISNSLKYAFPEGSGGEIKIECRQSGDGEIRIRYCDTGGGLPEGFDLRQSNPLGIKLIKRLTEGQLGGKVEIKAGRGTEFLITFREPHYVRRI
ncbi:MAG: GAF domain-containing protein [Nitrospirales bacterium]|nr:GAF domain-containing protein [Nitrospirales bacterium]